MGRMLRLLTCVVFAAALPAAHGASAGEPAAPPDVDLPPKPKSPEASLRSIRVRPGFTVELMAAEPLVLDPISFAFGADGKLWVVEMGDYPLGVREEAKRSDSKSVTRERDIQRGGDKERGRGGEKVIDKPQIQNPKSKIDAPPP